MLIEQYNGFEPAQLPGQHVNGALTIGENIGDLGGLTIAYKAYKRSLKGKEAPVIDGLTGEQRFFIGWAQVWRSKYRDAEHRPPAGHRSPLARRVPLQRRAPQPARVLRGLRRQGRRQALAAPRTARPDLVRSSRRFLVLSLFWLLNTRREPESPSQQPINDVRRRPRRYSEVKLLSISEHRRWSRQSHQDIKMQVHVDLGGE